MERSLIVHPTDLLSSSEGAFFHALRLGLAVRSSLTLVHVHTYDVEEVPALESFPRVRDALTHWGLLPAGASQAELSEKLGLYVRKVEVLAYNAEAGLVKLLRDQNATMIVLGTRGLTGLQRLREGSFSEHLARDAKIPALFVPNGAKGFVNGHDGTVHLKNVLVPVTTDPDPSRAVSVALGLVDLFGQDSSVHLLHVGRSGSMPPVAHEDRSRLSEIVRQGPVAETIVDVAKEVSADLIVMATAGHKTLLDAVRGSTTEVVLRGARCALLAVPAGRAEPDIRALEPRLEPRKALAIAPPPADR
jgi:nucleotide-binding universal stress UspA family protein